MILSLQNSDTLNSFLSISVILIFLDFLRLLNHHMSNAVTYGGFRIILIAAAAGRRIFLAGYSISFHVFTYLCPKIQTE